MNLEAWSLVVVGWLVIGFAYLFPEDFRNPNPGYLRIALAAFMIRAFQFHLGLFFVLLLAGVLVAQKWRLGILNMALVGFLWWPTLWEWMPRTPPAIAGDGIRIMSINLLVSNRENEVLLRQIREVAPDIILFQEYSPHWQKTLSEELRSVWLYRTAVARDDSFGAAIYSRLPFVGEVEQYLPLGDAAEPQMRAVINVFGRHVAVYHIHLLPPTGLEYVRVNRWQFDDLWKLLKKESLPIILGGDFNFTETSSQAGALAAAGLREAQAMGGWGRGTTWPVDRILGWAPGLRLDHLYLSSELACTECYPGADFGSDHLPVIAKIGFRKAER